MPAPPAGWADGVIRYRRFARVNATFERLCVLTPARDGIGTVGWGLGATGGGEGGRDERNGERAQWKERSETARAGGAISVRQSHWSAGRSLARESARKKERDG